ncbi:CDP-alcohol phosphatidyltransferase family protein [Salinarimonas ramus]|uniref:Membrane protein n=1 Tax=Salinarimonas ramus TaxID=690164 RepID=A0A917Q464_9HYPH|nr:CDP-alcohol phosphatidyltransferase family protein [Salinarimonas ramus]GGK20049.1 membrane protein [Salinarimonas ramus]
MLDGVMRRLIDPPLTRAGVLLARAGIGADAITSVGLVLGLACAGAIAASADVLALVFLALSRLCDGLDGAVARASEKTDRGGFLDIVFDFVFYGAVPLGFALREPALFGLPAAVLLFAFYVNGASFLAFATVAAKRGMETAARGIKSIYFTAGLAEGTETILAFALMILFPQLFPIISYAFAGLTVMTAISRIAFAWTLFRDDDDEERDAERR